MATTSEDPAVDRPSGRPGPPGGPPAGPAAFLLTQIGTLAATRFAERIAELELTPPQVGLLRAVAGRAGQSQQALARHLGTPPSRLVALVDGLDQRGLLERRRNPDDRRLHALHLTDAGQAVLRRVAEVGRRHNAELCAALDPDEQAVLTALLGRVAAAHGLAPGVHPGFRTI